MKVLIIGDVMGRPGRDALKEFLDRKKSDFSQGSGIFKVDSLKGTDIYCLDGFTPLQKHLGD
jgi:calcineurin-like phosphoesterase